MGSGILGFGQGPPGPEYYSPSINLRLVLGGYSQRNISNFDQPIKCMTSRQCFESRYSVIYIPTSIFKKTQQWNLIELFAFLLPIIILHNVAAK